MSDYALAGNAREKRPERVAPRVFSKQRGEGEEIIKRSKTFISPAINPFSRKGKDTPRSSRDNYLSNTKER